MESMPEKDSRSERNNWWYWLTMRATATVQWKESRPRTRSRKWTNGICFSRSGLSGFYISRVAILFPEQVAKGIEREIHKKVKHRKQESERDQPPRWIDHQAQNTDRDLFRSLQNVPAVK